MHHANSAETSSDATLRLNVRALALTCGLIWGIGLFVLTWWITAFDGVTHQATLIGQVYRGYTISPVGSLIFGYRRSAGLVQVCELTVA